MRPPLRAKRVTVLLRIVAPHWKNRRAKPNQGIRIARQCLHAYWVPSHPAPGINRGKYRYPDSPCSDYSSIEPTDGQCSRSMPISMRTGFLLRRDASQGQDHRGVAQGQCGVPSVDQTGGRSLINLDSSVVLACLLGPISPHPGHRSWEGTGTATARVPS